MAGTNGFIYALNSFFPKFMGAMNDAGGGFKGILSGIGTLLSPAGIVGLTAALTVGAVAWTSYATSIDGAIDKAEKSAKALSDANRDLSNAQSKRDENKNQIEKLQKTENRTAQQEIEIRNLEAQNTLLEAQEKIKKEAQKNAKEQAAEDANAALTNKNGHWWQIIATSASIAYAAHDVESGYKDIISETSDLISDRVKLEETIQQASTDILSLESGSKEFKEKEKVIENAQERVDKLSGKIVDNKSTILSLYESLLGSDEYSDTVNRIEKLFPELNPEKYVKQNLQALNKGGLLSWYDSLDESQKKVVFDMVLNGDAANMTVDEFKQKVLETDEVVKALEAAAEHTFEGFKGTISAASAVQADLAEAVASSAKGLSVEQIEKVANAFKDLEGYNPEKLFEETATGVRLNASEFEKYNKALLENQRNNIEQKIIDKQKEINNAKNDGKAESYISGLKNELALMQSIAASYDAATSKYNKYISAMSASNERDSLENIAKGYKGIGDLINQGWTTDDSVIEYLDLLLGTDRVQSSADAYKKLGETISGTSHSLKDYMTLDSSGNFTSKGAWDFVKDLQLIQSEMGKTFVAFEDGTYKLSLSSKDVETVAKRFGTTTEFIELIAKTLHDSGMKDLSFGSDNAKPIVAEDNNPEPVEGKVVATEVDTSGLETPEVNVTLKTDGTIAGVPSSINIPANIVVRGFGNKTGNMATGYVGGIASGTMLSASHAYGTAYNVLNYKPLHPSFANGKVSLPKDELALTNEVGRESVVRDGQWYLLPPGPHMEHLKKGDIIFSAKQTQDLLNFGRTNSYAKSYAHGTADLAKERNALIRDKLAARDIIPALEKSVIMISGSASKPGTENKTPTSNGSGGGKKSDKEESKIDWIEIAIKRIQNAVNKLQNIATSAFKSLKTRLGATSEEIATITSEIELQKKASDRYLQEADSVGLSDDLKKKVQNGEIDIASYDEETQKLITEYQNWYDKSIECANAVDTLHDSLSNLYQDNFNNIKSDFENQLSLLDSQSKHYKSGIDMMETVGYSESTKYYNELSNITIKNIETLNDELSQLQSSFDSAMSSGEIEEGSEAWYAMKGSINGVKESIDDANISLAEYAEKMREINWFYLDYASDQISKMNDEAEFMIDLIDSSDMFDKDGNITDTGMATAGLRGERYNTYMALADKYAKEIQDINKEIANDPYNTKLLERREDLLKSQRDSISAAEDEKDAIVDLVNNGIEIQLENMKNLIDEYSDAIDSAKDLYDYQNKVKKQSDNIKNIQKQLSAYSGDTSEETAAKVQKLQVTLQDAKDDLKDAEYDQYVKDQKKLLDDLYSEYEEVMNSRLDDVDALISDVITEVNGGSASICEKLIDVSESVGYTMSNELMSIWDGSSGTLDGTLSMYGHDLGEKLTSINRVIDGILVGVVAMSEHSDYVASANISKINRDMIADFTDIAQLTSVNGNGISSAYLSTAIANANMAAGFIENRSATGSNNIGEINITIPIDHVEDYDDFVNKLRADPKFEGLVKSLTIDRLNGGSSLDKNRFRW